MTDNKNSYSIQSFSKLKQVLFSSSSIALIFIFVKLLGFFEKLVLANYFGTGDDADAYLMAYSIPFAFFLVFEEILGPVLVPFLVQKIGKENIEYGIKILKRIAVGLFLILIIFSIFGSLNASWFISNLAPGFEGSKQILAIDLLEKLFLTLILLAGSSFFTVIFHAYKKFNLPVFARAIEKFIIVFSILLLHNNYGIQSAVIGCIIGSFLRVSLLIFMSPIQARNLRISSEIEIDKGELKSLLILMLPLLGGVLFSQVSALVDNFVASQLGTGAVSSLSYARKIIDLPILVVPFSMGIVLLPHLSSLSSVENREEFALLFERCFKILFSIFGFLTVLVFVFNVPVIKLLFERGKFDSTSTKITAKALLWFAPGLIAFAVEIPIMQSFFALKDTLTPIWIGICCAIFNIFLTLTFVPYLGYIIVPIALSVQKILKVGFLFMILRRKVFLNLKYSVNFVIKILINILLTTVILSYVQKNVIIFSDLSFINLIIYIAIGSFISLFIFLGASLILKIEEISRFMRYCQQHLMNIM
jgi:murein biosynthesis integral membrane protein MurJ